MKKQISMLLATACAASLLGRLRRLRQHHHGFQLCC